MFRVAIQALSFRTELSEILKKINSWPISLKLVGKGELLSLLKSVPLCTVSKFVYPYKRRAKYDYVSFGKIKLGVEL